MKKSLIAFLLSCSCAFTLAAVACEVQNPFASGNSSSVEESANESSSSVEESANENSSSAAESAGGTSSDDSSIVDSSVTEELVAVTLTEGDGYSYTECNAENGGIAKGETLSFRVKTSVFYTGTPVVFANDKAITPDVNGVYAVAANEAVVIRVDGLRKDVSSMVGTGAFDDAFLVTKPVDLLYIAEQVNKGVQSYVTGAYVIGNDIDCGGEELKIIGDLSTNTAYFSGCVSALGDTDEETGETERFTISNFVINSDSSNYVGLFGAVQANPNVTGSGLFYGVRLENFTINASVSADAHLDSKTIVCGGLVGYGVGTNLQLCDASGSINLSCDSNYFSYAGGLIGYQQGTYYEAYAQGMAAEIAYAAVDVDVNVLGGMALYAGGIAGYLTSDYPYSAVSYVHNSYSTGNVSGAMRSGGVVGGMGQYSSVSNCYATGEISATNSRLNDGTADDVAYYYAYAGGLVGFAENDCIVNDSFFAGKTTAKATASSAYAKTDNYVGGGKDAGYFGASSQQYVVNNCVYSENANDLENLQKTLAWEDINWDFEQAAVQKAYPKIFYGTSDNAITATMTICYVDNNGNEVKVDGDTQASVAYFSSSGVYSYFGALFYNGKLSIYAEADNAYLSYGYFFDKECTQRVPLSYLPEKDLTLYFGFADPTPLVGTYYVANGNNGRMATLDFAATGLVTYSDGNETDTTNYTFDGKTVIVENARLARYYRDTLADDLIYSYSYYDFVGSVETVNGEKTLSLYDSVYFTEAAPLTAKTSLLIGEYYVVQDGAYTYYTFANDTITVEGDGAYYEFDTMTIANGEISLSDSTGIYDPLQVKKSDLREYDAFKGTWTKSATVHKTYTFDGAGNWEYIYYRYERKASGMQYVVEPHKVESRNGTYTVEEGVLTFTDDGVAYTAKFNSDGFLVVGHGNEESVYYKNESYLGTWHGGGVALQLLGIGENGAGSAIVTYSDGNSYDLVYELSEQGNYVMLYLLSSGKKGSLLGYFRYAENTNTLSVKIYDPYSTADDYYTETYMYVVDDYVGEWISDAEAFRHVDFCFNGNGLYDFLNGVEGSKGEIVLTENGEETKVAYTLDSQLQGNFGYNGVNYKMRYDEATGNITLTAADETASLQRKDVLSEHRFVASNGTEYVFDGRGSLSIGGTLTVGNGAASYTYKANGEEAWLVYANGAEVGSMAREEAHYALRIGDDKTDLYIVNEFMGTWAVSGKYTSLIIGYTDLDGKIAANYLDNDVTLTYLDASTLTFNFTNEGMPVRYYVFVVADSTIGDDVLVLSEYTSIAAAGDEYQICTKANSLFGTWTSNKDKKLSISFDGVTSGYVNGCAKISRQGDTTATPYYYRYYEQGILMWSQDALAGKTWYYKIVEVDLTENPELINDRNLFVNEDGTRAFRRVEADGVCFVEATDVNDASVTYYFDGEGGLYANGVKRYTYKLTSYNDNNTVSMEITEIESGKTYAATLNYANVANATLAIEALIAE